MPRWLSSFLITIGALALIAMALLPNQIIVNVEVESEVHEKNHTEITNNYNHAQPNDPATVPQ